MLLESVNRDAEQRELHAAAKRGGLLIVYGRRRIGKTRLLRTWLQGRDGLYSQAIEGQLDMQIQQVFQDLRPRLETEIVPETWPELLEILALQEKRWVLCLDEFPYLTALDASLPSRLQSWLDRRRRSGSSSTTTSPRCSKTIAGRGSRARSGTGRTLWS